jgi:transcriptional regulator with XRE-family HTH domain
MAGGRLMPAGLISQLKQAIREDGRSLNQIAQATGVGSDRLSRFMTGKRGLSIDALDKIWLALGLRIVGPQGGDRLTAAKGE